MQLSLCTILVNHKIYLTEIKKKKRRKKQQKITKNAENLSWLLVKKERAKEGNSSESSLRAVMLPHTAQKFRTLLLCQEWFHLMNNYNVVINLQIL